MARGRIIDKEIFSHEVLGMMSIEAKYLYHGLIVFADDEGRLKANPKYLKAKIFPYDNIKESEIEKMVNQMATTGLLLVYQVGESWFLSHPKWDKWQPIRRDRFSPSDCPAPVDGKPLVNQMATNGQPDDNPYLTQPNLTQPKEYICPNFQKFWNSYPRREAKQKAIEAFNKINPDDDLLNKMIIAIEKQKESKQWQDNIIPHPTTWLNGRRWEDEPIQAKDKFKDEMEKRRKMNELSNKIING